MAQRKWAGKTERLQKRHCGPNALLCQIYKFTTPESEKKVTYITTDQRKKKKKKAPMAQFSSPPLHSLVLSLSISAAPSLAALFLSHFVTPRLSPSFPRQRLGELSPLIQMRGVACMKVFFLHKCVLPCPFVHIPCVCVFFCFFLYLLLKWYGRQRRGGKVIQPTCY